LSNSPRHPSSGRARPIIAAVAVTATFVASHALNSWGAGQLELTVLYLVPITAAVYAFGMSVGLGVVTAALLSLSLVHPVAHWSVVAGDILIHFAIFIFAAVLVDRLRRQLHVIQALEAERDADLSIARELQRGILDSSPTRDERFDVSLTLRFAREVGGDYCRVDRLDGDLFVCVGDISGKGAGAALFSSLLNESIRDGLAAEAGLVTLVEMVNDRLYASTAAHMFVTMFFGVLSDAALTYINAGHVPPLLLAADSGEITELAQVGSPPLGILPDLDLAPSAVRFTYGDVLLACTDGITESSALMREPGRLGSTLKAGAGKSTDGIVELIVALAEESNDRVDDVTVLVIRRRAIGSPSP